MQEDHVEDQKKEEERLKALEDNIMRPLELDQMICQSISTFQIPDQRKKLANSIVLVGGFANTQYFVDSLEEQLLESFASYDPEIERVEVLLQNSILTQMMALKEKDRASTSASTQCFALPESVNGKSAFAVDPRFVSWVGGAIVPKMDCAKEMGVTREKWGVKVEGYEGALGAWEQKVRQ